MIRRIIMVAAAAAALILVPSAAMAAPTLSCTASPSAPVVGQPVKVDCSGGTKNQRVTLYVGTAASLTKNLNANGVGTFSVRFTAVGDYTVTMKSAAGATLFTLPTIHVSPKYHARGYTSTVSDSTPNAGASFTVSVLGVVANAPVTLTTCPSDGARTLNETANASGVATFRVTLTKAGVCTLTARVAGVVVSTQTLTVLGVSANAPIPAAVGALPRTGFDPKGLLVGGGLLLLAGTGALLSARRRRSAQVSA